MATGSIDDESKLYWDVRLPVKTPTVEVRVADVCTTVDEAVLLAGLTRALAQTCAAEAQRDAAFPAARPELLRAAHWRAARYGLEGELIDVAAERAVPAHDLVQTLLAFVRPALEEQGDWDEIAALTQQTLRGGTGAARQRAAYQRAGRWDDVVDLWWPKRPGVLSRCRGSAFSSWPGASAMEEKALRRSPAVGQAGAVAPQLENSTGLPGPWRADQEPLLPSTGQRAWSHRAGRP